MLDLSETTSNGAPESISRDISNTGDFHLHTDFTTNLDAKCDCSVREPLRLHSGDEREELCCISFCPLLILLAQVGQTASYGQAGE